MENKQTVFKVIAGGPLEVRGPIRIKGPDGKTLERQEPVYFCRCGHSSNKPFCDGTHKLQGFSG